MLHLADQDFIARLQALPKTGGDQIDRLGRAACEHDFLGARGIEKSLYLHARRFICVCSELTQGVDAAVNVCVLRAVVVVNRFNNGVRILRRRGVIEIHERVTVDRFRQDRKIRAHALHVEYRLEFFSAHPTHRCLSR